MVVHEQQKRFSWDKTFGSNGLKRPQIFQEAPLTSKMQEPEHSTSVPSNLQVWEHEKNTAEKASEV